MHATYNTPMDAREAHTRVQARLDTQREILARVRQLCDCHIMECLKVLDSNGYPHERCIYEIPGSLVGFPLFNADAICISLSRELRRSNFEVNLLTPRSLLISWRAGKRDLDSRTAPSHTATPPAGRGRAMASGTARRLLQKYKTAPT